MRRITALLMVAALCGGARDAEAFGFLDRAYGTPQLGASTRSRAMGGVGVAVGQGAFSLVDNPAALTLMPGNHAQITGFLSRQSENRFVPVFDTFQSFVDETAIAVNDENYASLEGGVVVDRWERTGIVVAGGVFNRYDPRYDYFDEIRTADNSDILLGTQELRTEGVLRAATLGAAVPIQGRASLGLSLNYYFGTIEDASITVARDVSDPAGVIDLETGSVRTERDLNGVSLTFGGTLEVGPRLRLGASVETAPNLDDTYDMYTDGVLDTAAAATGDLKLPLRFQGGFTYRPRNTFETTFAADVVFMSWSGAEDHLNPDLDLQDTWEVRFGVEHVFYNDLAGRIGFRYGESSVMDDANTAAFTFGFGSEVDRLRLDVAGEVGKRNSRQDPIRDRGSLGGRIGLGMDRIEATLARVTFGATYTFE